VDAVWSGDGRIRYGTAQQRQAGGREQQDGEQRAAAS
jgi:hypothetical protein